MRVALLVVQGRISCRRQFLGLGNNPRGDNSLKVRSDAMLCYCTFAMTIYRYSSDSIVNVYIR